MLLHYLIEFSASLSERSAVVIPGVMLSAHRNDIPFLCVVLWIERARKNVGCIYIRITAQNTSSGLGSLNLCDRSVQPGLVGAYLFHFII